MANSTERESISTRLTERPEEASPLVIERKEVVTPTPTQFKGQVTDDNGRPLIQTPPSSVISVSPPVDDATLMSYSKGKTDDSLTWFGVFWRRIVKKAVHFGWKVVRPTN